MTVISIWLDGESNPFASVASSSNNSRMNVMRAWNERAVEGSEDELKIPGRVMPARWTYVMRRM